MGRVGTGLCWRDLVRQWIGREGIWECMLVYVCWLAAVIEKVEFLHAVSSCPDIPLWGYYWTLWFMAFCSWYIHTCTYTTHIILSNIFIIHIVHIRNCIYIQYTCPVARHVPEHLFGTSRVGRRDEDGWIHLQSSSSNVFSHQHHMNLWIGLRIWLRRRSGETMRLWEIYQIFISQIGKKGKM